MTEPEILYHYTTASGLVNIIQSQTLWATNAEFLNDAQELKFGRDELRKELLRQADGLSPEGSDVIDADYTRATVMRSAANHLGPPGLFAGGQYHFVYVTCFCGVDDLLSRWQGYGGSGGYAIGFRSARLRHVRPAEAGARTREYGSGPGGTIDESAKLIKVRYGDTAMKAAITTVLDSIAPDPVGFPGSTGYFRAQTIVLPALAGIKHDAFREEREWRLVVVTDQHKPSFRTGSLGVIPYITLSYPTDAITEVVIGPGSEQPLREQGVRLLVGPEVVVRSSHAPFRG